MYQRHDPKGRDLWLALEGVPGKFLRKEGPRVPGRRSPTVRRRELGALLRTLRTEQGLTVEQVAESLLCSASKVSRMETGQRGATARDIRDLCDLYGVTDATERTRMSKLAAEGKQQGWWQSHELEYFATYVGLEEDAVTAKQYQSSTVPGLLQTSDYARVMAEVLVPAVPPERIDELVEVKLTRQRLLTQDPPLVLSAILDEAVLHRVVGGPSVMRSQLDQLISASSLPNVTIQVIPYSAGAHTAMDSTFSMLEFASPVAEVVYVEGLVGWIYIERPQDIQKYQDVFEHLSTVALSPQESIELITKVSAEYLRAKTGAART